MSYVTGQVAVSTTATLIVDTGYPFDSDGVLLTASAACYIGGPDVTTTTGYPLAANTPTLIPTTASGSGGLYGITASGTATVSFISPS